MINPYTIYIEHTYRSTYASQGETPSGNEGWNIWIKEHGDDMLSFLGWAPLEELHSLIEYYIDQDSCTVGVRLPDRDTYTRITPEFLHMLSTENG